MEIEQEHTKEEEEEDCETGDRQRTWEAHCVGVCARGLLFQAHKPVRFIGVQWCPVSSNLCSPLYTHHMVLAPVPQQPHWYTLVTWLEYAPRLEDEHMKSSNVRELLNNTLFLLLDAQRPAWPDRVHHFPWHTAQKPLSVRYACQFDPLSLLTTPLSTAQFWATFRRVHHDTLTVVRATLKMCESVTDAQLYGVFAGWYQHQHLAPFLHHRLLEMDDLFTAARHNDTLRLDLARLATGHVQDLAALHRQVRLAKNGTLLAQRVHRYVDMPSLVSHTLRNQLATLLRHHFPEPCVDRAARRQLVTHVLVPALMCALEERALRSADSCFPVTLESLLWHYNQLLGLDTSHSAILPFQHSPAVPPEWDSVTHFAVQHLPEIVACMREARRTLQWTCVLKRDEPLYKLYEPLFVIECQPAELEHERDLHSRLWLSTDWSRHCLALLPPDAVQWDIAAWRREYEALEDIERSLYDTRLVLLQFAPVELRQACDMAAVYTLLRTDFHATAVLLPPRGYGCATVRMQQYFQANVSDITLEQLQEKTFMRLDEAALRDTLVVLDAHVYSNAEMQSLFNWLEASRQHYSRCVMMGAYDTHPLHCAGHAFTDLLQWHDRVAVRRASFDSTMHCTQFRALLQCAQERRLRVIHATTAMQSLIGELCGGAELVDLCLIETVQALPAKKERFAKPSALQMAVTDDVCSREQCLRYEIATKSLALTSIANVASRDNTWNRTVFLVDRAFLEKLQRNELNHLLTVQCDLIVLDRQAVPVQPEDALQWLVTQVERQRYPNLRHTLPFLAPLVQKSSATHSTEENLYM